MCSLTTDADQTLKRRHKQMWTKSSPDRCGRRMCIVRKDKKARLTTHEWRSITLFIEQDPHVICTLATQFGFTLALVMTRHHHEVYPGARMDPETLIVIHQAHLPRPLRGPDGAFIKGGGGFEDGWRYFSPLTHSDWMVSRIRSFNLSDPVDVDRLRY